MRVSVWPYFGMENYMGFKMKSSLHYGFPFIKDINGKMDIYVDKNGPYIITRSDVYKNNYIMARNHGSKIRFLTEVTKDNIQYCKDLRDIVDEFKHLEGLRGSLCISGSEFISATTLKEKQFVYPIIYSKEKEFVEQYQFVFDIIWKKAISISQRILEIETGVVPKVMETISDINEILGKNFDILDSANSEILLIYSTCNAFHRQVNAGSIKKLKEIGENKPWITIKLLTPKDDVIEKIGTELSTSNFNIKFIEPLSKVSILIVDRRNSLVVETKDDTKEILEEAIGFVTFSNSVPTVLSYTSIFESFWKQAELYENTKNELDKTKDEMEEMKEHINFVLNEMHDYNKYNKRYKR
jgi:two-component system, OmpR family, sensor histidine kinase VicK